VRCVAPRACVAQIVSLAPLSRSTLMRGNRWRAGATGSRWLDRLRPTFQDSQPTVKSLIFGLALVFLALRVPILFGYSRCSCLVFVVAALRFPVVSVQLVRVGDIECAGRFQPVRFQARRAARGSAALPQGSCVRPLQSRPIHRRRGSRRLAGAHLETSSSASLSPLGAATFSPTIPAMRCLEPVGPCLFARSPPTMFPQWQRTRHRGVWGGHPTAFGGRLADETCFFMPACSS
jgi:hypothetical protein